MRGTLNWRKIILLSALCIAPLLLANCGSGQGSVPQSTVGPVGPTQPSGYFFDLMVTPNVLFVGGGVSALVHVWDSNGNVASGAPISFTFSGIDAFDSAGGVLLSSETGVAQMIMEYKGVGLGGLSFITATIENRTLTAPVTLVAPGQ